MKGANGSSHSCNYDSLLLHRTKLVATDPFLFQEHDPPGCFQGLATKPRARFDQSRRQGALFGTSNGRLFSLVQFGVRVPSYGISSSCVGTRDNGIATGTHQVHQGRLFAQSASPWTLPVSNRRTTSEERRQFSLVLIAPRLPSDRISTCIP